MLIKINNQTKLQIFENFQVDRNLLKYKTSANDVQSVAWQMSQNSTGFITANSTNAVISGIWSNQAIGVPTPLPTKPFSTWFQRMKLWIEDKKLKSPEIIFESLIKGQSELELDLATRINAIDSMKVEAKANGQDALYETITKNESRLKSEAVLATAGFRMFIDEDTLVQFTKLCKKGLRLDWIKNFNRVIPKEVSETKLKADQLKLFDNYVILHFDPEGKSTQLTEEEVRRKKDPILFGVFNESRRLYFIGDWKDEFCDLTLEELIKTLSADDKNAVSKLVLP